MSSLDKDSDRTKFLEEMIVNLDTYTKVYLPSFKLTKTKMDDLFRRRKILKSGEEGASYEYPTTLTLHTNIEYLKSWVEYSVLDSEATFYLR